MFAVAFLGALITAGVHFGRSALEAVATLPAAPSVAAASSTDANRVGPREFPVMAHADRDFVTTLQRDFATRLRDARAQVRLLERLEAHVATHHPRAEATVKVSLLEAAFPAQSAELHHQSQKLVRYRTWIAAHRDTLRLLPAEQRRAALWQARRRAFGDSAELIWAAELRHRVPIGSAIAAP